MRRASVKFTMSEDEYKAYRKTYMAEWHKKNKEKRKEAQLKYKKANPNKVKLSARTSELKLRLGVTLAEYEECMKTSDSCEICGTTKGLEYDHCHIVSKGIKAFRGVLCGKHNRALGVFGDSLEGIGKAFNYMKKYYDR